MRAYHWNRRHWTAAAALLVLGIFYGASGISEAIAVSWLGHAGEYPFGSEGPSADTWYYASRERYTWVMAASGGVWCLLSLLSIIATWRKNEKLLVGIMIGAGMMFVAETVSANIPQ